MKLLMEFSLLSLLLTGIAMALLFICLNDGMMYSAARRQSVLMMIALLLLALQLICLELLINRLISLYQKLRLDLTHSITSVQEI
jgi:hypothetical protein